MMLARLAKADAAVVGHRLRAAARGAVEVVEIRAADARRQGRKAHRHHLGAEPKRFQHLRAPIARDTGDTHLGHHLEQARLEGLAVARGGFIADRGECQVWMNRRRTDGDQARDVVDVDRVTRDRDDVGRHPPPGREEVRVHRAHRERHRHRHAVQRRTPVAQRDHAGDLAGLAAQAKERVAERFVRRVRRVEDGRALQHPRELGGAEHRRFQLEHLSVGRKCALRALGGNGGVVSA